MLSKVDSITLFILVAPADGQKHGYAMKLDIEHLAGLTGIR
jgi:hypothetical protein